MVGIQFRLRTISGIGFVVDQRNAVRSILKSFNYNSSDCPFQFGFREKESRRCKSLLISCEASRGSLGDGPRLGEDHEDEYLEATVLISETSKHYRFRKLGFQEGLSWQSSSHVFPSSFHVQFKDSKPDISSSIGLGFFQRFQNPTIFLKISCDGDFLLPIIVGEVAVEMLIDALHLQEDGNEGCPNQFQLVRNLVENLGYEVKMVKISRRVANTYFSRIYFSKPGEKDRSVDARPSDAINVAKRCQAPIYVNKKIVLTDCIRLGYGTGRPRDTKSIYDVMLDSAPDGPDLLLEELDLVRNMNLAVEEERYNDAAMWRRKLIKLRQSTREV